MNTIVANTNTVHHLPVSVSACNLQVHPTIAGTPQYPDFGPAQQYWIAGSKVISADTNRYLSTAEHWLKAAKVYPTQVAQVAQLIALPITGLTPAQITTARRHHSLQRILGHAWPVLLTLRQPGRGSAPASSDSIPVPL